MYVSNHLLMLVISWYYQGVTRSVAVCYHSKFSEPRRAKFIMVSSCACLVRDSLKGGCRPVILGSGKLLLRA